jgi:hypothetical protein
MSTIQVAARRGYLTCGDREIGPAGRQVPDLAEPVGPAECATIVGIA